MGVKDLWKVLRPAASTQSVTRLAVDGFNTNLDGNRGYRIGIDASIWFGHTEKLKNRQRLGKNHALRTLFFRCTHLLEVPILPVFVFDGQDRPLVKRGKVSHFKESKLVAGMKELIDAFGFQWHLAPGEAEAELAYLNQIGVIDAVWTDDADTLLFGATTVIRNPSSTLSGNVENPLLNAESRADGKHVLVVNAGDLASHDEVQLTRGGLILIALLRGGDYGKGVSQIGIQIALGLARCGFGESLLKGTESLDGKPLREFLAGWRTDILSELRSNSRGFLGRKQGRLAESFPHDFPDLDILAAYVSPVVSGSKGTVPQFDWHRKLDISALAEVCERTFEWDDDTLLKRFASLVWPGAAMRVLRDTIVSVERSRERQYTRNDAPASSSARSIAPQPEPSLRRAPVIAAFHGQRKHASTDYVLELRAEINTDCFVQSAKAGLSSSHQQLPAALPARSSSPGLLLPKRGVASAKTPATTLRIWLPACIAQLAAPQLGAVKKRSHDSNPAADKAGNVGGERGSRKMARTSAHNTSPRGLASSASKRAQSPVIDLASDSDGDVIVISDSDDAHDGVDGSTRPPDVIIDLTL
ncbi:PIN domain-like protein [Auricularia subglabra TFB-10046 SS5]|nr:PIN domain-like protein [Auricularia subglabra TFB-10046 SS5]